MRELGQVYVTLTAAQHYAADARQVWEEGEALGIEDARRELLELALEAHEVSSSRKEEHSGLHRVSDWRLARQGLGIDLSMRVVRESSRFSEAPIFVVISAHARTRSARRRR
jgi:hypothetical protein